MVFLVDAPGILRRDNDGALDFPVADVLHGLLVAVVVDRLEGTNVGVDGVEGFADLQGLGAAVLIHYPQLGVTNLSANSVVVRVPSLVRTRYIAAPSDCTEVTPPRPCRRCSQSAGGFSNCTSITVDPGTLAFSARGVSSATSLPWSTMAIRSQRRSASSM